MHSVGLTPIHDPENPRIYLDGRREVPMKIENDISMVEVEVPDKMSMSTQRSFDRTRLWHHRSMHLGLEKLIQAGLVPSTTKPFTCNVCLTTKAKQRTPKTDPLLKDTPTHNGEILVLDLMLPSSHQETIHGIKAAMILVDVKSRRTEVAFLKQFHAKSVTEAFQSLLLRLSCNPRLLIMDRQSGFVSTYFVNRLHQRDIRYKLVPRNKHSIFAGLVERNIQTLRQMGRSAMELMQVDLKF